MPKKPELSPEDQALRERMGVAIRAVSLRHGKKPADLAAAGGVSLAHQYRIEAGERTPDALYLIKIAKYLDVSVDSLLAQSEIADAPQREASQKARSGGINVGGGVSGSVVQTNTGHGAVQIGHVGGPPTPKRKPKE